MRNTVLKLTLGLITIMSATVSRGQWVHANNSSGEVVYCITADTSSVFIGTEQGIFGSNNGGDTWNRLQGGLPDTAVYCMANKGGLFLAGTGAGAFLSTNKGVSWTLLGGGLPDTTIRAIAFGPAGAGGTTVYAVVDGYGLYVSLDGGDTWTQAVSSLADQRVSCFATSGDSLFAGTEGNGLYISTNGGGSWVQENSSLTGSWINDIVVGGTGVYAANYAGVFFLPKNESTWFQLDTGITDKRVYCLAKSGEGIYAGTYDGGVFLTTNGAVNWEPVSDGLPNSPVLCLASGNTSGGGQTIFAGTSGSGVYLTTNTDSNWNQIMNGLSRLPNSEIYSFVNIGDEIFAGTAGNGVCFSENGGATWSQAGKQIAALSVRALTAVGDSLFAGTNDGVFLSTDEGSSWASADSGMPDLSVYSLAANGTVVFAGTSAGFYISTDGGSDWMQESGISNESVRSIAISPGGTEMFAGTAGNGVYRSMDKGATWTQVNSGLTNEQVYSLVLAGDSLYAGTHGGGVYVSADNGATWSQMNAGLSNTWINALAVPNDTTLIAGTDNGIFFMVRASDRWLHIDGGLNVRSNSFVYAFDTVDSMVLAGMGDGSVWNRALSDMPAPAQPVLISIPNGYREVSVLPVLTWMPAYRAISYHLQVAADTAFTSPNIDTLITGGGSTVDSISTGLASNTIYYWRVEALDTDGVSGPWSQVWSFATILPTPALAVPADDSVGVNASTILSWYGVSGSESYRLQISRDTTFAHPAVDTSVAGDTSFAISTLGKDTTYFWRVNATGGLGTGNWSTVWRFTTGPVLNYALYQNYPNPFNPTTTISFDLKEQSTVLMDIYDILGRRVLEENLGMMNPGRYEEVINLGRYASGVYFCKVSMAGVDGERFTSVKKMVLLK